MKYLSSKTLIFVIRRMFCLIPYAFAYSYLYCTYFLIWFDFIFVYVYYKLFASGLMLGFDPKCVIFRDDIRVFPVSIICPSTLTELIRSISQDELAKFHKIAWNLLTFPIPIALYFRPSYFLRSKLNVGVFSVGSRYLPTICLCCRSIYC